MGQVLSDLIEHHPPDAPAIGGAGRDWLTYGGLRALTVETRQRLHALGLGTGDRVALVLPNGPEAASSFFALSQTVTTAPLNPAYQVDEFEFYLRDLKARAIVLPEGDGGPALWAAQKAGLTILRLCTDPRAPAGQFTLTTDTNATDDASRVSAAPKPADTALILHTSGTTSRPKIVPLTQENIATSARSICETLALSPADRCLNVMPLFHIHGLVAAVCASLAAGASVWCTTGFNARRFFSQMEECRPTWYTAVPTIHQAILCVAERYSAGIGGTNLRFLRSSSAALPSPVMTELEKVFGVPVIEAYGMTEAAHQMASNPLAAGTQKTGSVGTAAGPDLRIADETENRPIAPGEIGEVVISGPGVTPGYEDNPEANATSFFEADGRRWFRTGDQGAFDRDGYLRLTGRLKEIINRGGEKISPLEVDAMLLSHPEIAQAVTFAVPHPRFGEEVAAAVVLAEGSQLDQAAIRAFAVRRVVDFKAPRKILILKEIPKGATGKLQRIGLATKLGLARDAA